MAAQQRTDRAGAGRLLSLLKDAHLHGGGKRPAPWAVRNFRISRSGCQHDTQPAASFCTATHGGWHCQGYVRHDHETFSYEPQTLNFTGCFVSSSLAQRAVPSVDDCSRTAPSPAPSGLAGTHRNQGPASIEITGWSASDSPAGIRRNTHDTRPTRCNSPSNRAAACGSRWCPNSIKAARRYRTATRT